MAINAGQGIHFSRMKVRKVPFCDHKRIYDIALRAHPSSPFGHAGFHLPLHGD